MKVFEVTADVPLVPLEPELPDVPDVPEVEFLLVNFTSPLPVSYANKKSKPEPVSAKLPLFIDKLPVIPTEPVT